MSKAAVMTTASTNGEMGALWMDTGFNINSRQITLGFDINVLQAPSRLTDPVNSQVMTINGDSTNTAGVLFAARLYDGNNGQWAFTVDVVPTSATGGVFTLRNVDGTNNTMFGTYTNGQANRVMVVGDYATGEADTLCRWRDCILRLPSSRRH